MNVLEGWVAVALSSVVAAAAVFRLPRHEVLCGRGRHISRPLVRRLGTLRTSALRFLLAVTIVLSWVITYPDAFFLPVVAAFNVWMIDDWLCREDDPRKRKHEWAKVKLWMPKPVKLRPLDRYPIPA